MDKVAFDDYVENRYKKQMEYYSKSSAKSHKLYKKFQWSLIILSALTPVVAAINGTSFSNGGEASLQSKVLHALLLIISSIVAILTSGLKTFQYQELWVNYRTTYEQLKPEIYYYEFNVPPYNGPDVDKELLFVSRVENVLDKEHKQWTPAKD